MPSLYTFTINCIGLVTSLSASILLLIFLNSRPSAQKNLLNRILALLTIILMFGTVRNFLVSLLACFWNTELQEFINGYPALSAGLLSFRTCSIIESVLACLLSGGRLLLVLNPAMFHNINPASTWAVVAGIVAIMLTALDFTYGFFICNKYIKTNPIFMLKAETGIAIEIEVNPFSKGSLNNTGQNKDLNDTSCKILPTLNVLIFCMIVLELVKLVWLFLKEFRKVKKASKVEPIQMNHIRPDPSQRAGSSKRLGEKKTIQRCESLPKMSKPATTRRNSLCLSLTMSEVMVKKVAKEPPRSPLNPDVSPIAVTNKRELFKGVMEKYVFRTASFITIVAMVEIIVAVSIGLNYAGESGTWTQIALSRLVAYVLVVVIVSCDKDIMFYLSTLLHH